MSAPTYDALTQHGAAAPPAASPSTPPSRSNRTRSGGSAKPHGLAPAGRVGRSRRCEPARQDGTRKEQPGTPQTEPRRDPGSAAAPAASTTLASLANTATMLSSDRTRWDHWARLEPRLTGFDGLEDVLVARAERDPRCYQVVAGLTWLGSRRGADDDAAALAVVVVLRAGVLRVASMLADVCEPDDVCSAVWEEVKAAEPQLGACAARFLLRRARQRLTRPSTGMVPRTPQVSLDALNGWGAPGAGAATHSARPDGCAADPPHAAAARGLLGWVSPAVDDDDPAQELSDLLRWAQNTGVISAADVALVSDLVLAEQLGLPREVAQRLVGQRHGVAMRTVRRRRDRATAVLRDAAPRYLAETA